MSLSIDDCKKTMMYSRPKLAAKVELSLLKVLPCFMMAAPLSCVVKPVVQVRIGDHKHEFHTGCSVMEVHFPNLHYVEIGEIHFRNYYTAWISLQCRSKEPNGGGESKWRTCVKRMTLMPDAHSDGGSEDYFTISQRQLMCDLHNVTRLRFIIRQPSPLWKEYRLEDVKIYRTSVHAMAEVPLPMWLTEAKDSDDNSGGKKKTTIEGFGSMEPMSVRLQQMWALIEQSKSNQPTVPIGRYDIDGSYEINLLSYS